MSFYDFMGHKAETQNIIDQHSKDFTYPNKPKDVKAYIRSLGGVFAKWVDFKGKITTYDELTEVGDYVTGLYDIWGVDYSNGCSYDDWHENRYKAKCGSVGAYYPNEAPKARFNMNYSTWGFVNDQWLPTVEEMLEKGYAITNCGQGVAQILKKAGLIPANYPDPAYRPTHYKSHGFNYKLIRNMSDLKVGDVLLLAHGKIPNRAKLTELKDWESWLFHTTIVGEKTSKYIITYDTGHAYTYYGETRNKRNLDQKPYEWCDDWIAMRLFDLNTNGEWVKKGDNWYYYKDGKPITGWHKLSWSGGTNWFWFDAKGVMATGFNKLKWSGGTDTFYFDRNGCMLLNWQKIDGKWYYFNKDGVMLTGLHRLKWNGAENWYLFADDGKMLTGEHTIKAKFDKYGLTGGKV